jgi:hypothetical protein
MADTQTDILTTLKKIESQLSNVSGASSDYIAKNRKASGLGNVATEKKTKGVFTGTDDIKNESAGLIKAFSNLRRETQKLAESENRYQKSMDKYSKATDVLDKHSKSMQGLIADNKSSATMFKKVQSTMSNLRQAGVNLDSSFSKLTATSSSEEIANAYSDATRALKAREVASKRAHTAAKARHDTREKQKNSSVKEFRDNLEIAGKAAITAFAGISSQVSLTAQNASLSFSPQGQGNPFEGLFTDTAASFFLPAELGKRFQGLADSFTGMVEGQFDTLDFGTSAQDVARFAAKNRSTLAAALNNSTLSLLDVTQGTIGGTEQTLAQFGDTLEKEFGFVGAQQLDAISKSFNILSKLGVQITPENLESLRQGVEDVASTSDMLADEVFSELAGLAGDVDFQALTLAMNQGENVIAMLTSSFTTLQKSVGLNIDEFIAYRKFLAKQRTRTGSERLVQSGYAGQLARSLGMDPKQIALIQRGVMSRETVEREGNGAEFDKLYNQMRELATNSRMDAAASGTMQGMSAIQAIDILMKGAGTEELMLRGRKQSGEVEAVAKAQDARLNQSKSQTSELQSINATINSYMRGIAQSAIGLPVVGFFKSMTGSVFSGTLLANVATKIAAPVLAIASAGATGWFMGTTINDPLLDIVIGKDTTIGSSVYATEEALFGVPETQMGELTRTISETREREVIIESRIKQAESDILKELQEKLLAEQIKTRELAQQDLDRLIANDNRPENVSLLNPSGSGSEKPTDARSGG